MLKPHPEFRMKSIALFDDRIEVEGYDPLQHRVYISDTIVDHRTRVRAPRVYKPNVMDQKVLAIIDFYPGISTISIMACMGLDGEMNVHNQMYQTVYNSCRRLQRRGQIENRGISRSHPSKWYSITEDDK